MQRLFLQSLRNREGVAMERAVGDFVNVVEGQFVETLAYAKHVLDVGVPVAETVTHKTTQIL